MFEPQPSTQMVTAATDDSAYLYNRAEAELDMAQRATHPAAVSAHYELANAYLERIYGPQMSEPAARAAG